MSDKLQVVTDNKIQDMTPEILAETFWAMNSEDQATFYNHLDKVADFRFPLQLQSITEEDGLSLAGRRVMQFIGDYSHWGITCQVIKGSHE